MIFFDRLFTDFAEFVANGSEFFESSERVIAIGSYSGRARRTGKSFTARFAHVWTLQDGLIVRLQQCADTVQLAHAWEIRTNPRPNQGIDADGLKRGQPCNWNSFLRRLDPVRLDRCVVQFNPTSYGLGCLDKLRADMIEASRVT